MYADDIAFFFYHQRQTITEKYQHWKHEQNISKIRIIGRYALKDETKNVLELTKQYSVKGVEVKV